MTMKLRYAVKLAEALGMDHEEIPALAHQCCFGGDQTLYRILSNQMRTAVDLGQFQKAGRIQRVISYRHSSFSKRYALRWQILSRIGYGPLLAIDVDDEDLKLMPYRVVLQLMPELRERWIKESEEGQNQPPVRHSRFFIGYMARRLGIPQTVEQRRVERKRAPVSTSRPVIARKTRPVATGVHPNIKQEDMKSEQE